jgi:hypothetical protein
VISQPANISNPLQLSKLLSSEWLQPMGKPRRSSSTRASAGFTSAEGAMVLASIGCSHNALPTLIELMLNAVANIRAMAKDHSWVLRL